MESSLKYAVQPNNILPKFPTTHSLAKSIDDGFESAFGFKVCSSSGYFRPQILGNTLFNAHHWSGGLYHQRLF